MQTDDTKEIREMFLKNGVRDMTIDCSSLSQFPVL